MAGAQAPAGFAVEVFVEQDQVAPVRVLGIAAVVAMTGAASVRVAQEEAGEPASQVVGDLLEVEASPGAGRAFHLEAVTVVVMVALQRFDEQVS